MKKMIKIAFVSFVFSLVFLMPLGVSADPPGVPGNHGETGDQPPGGSSPIGTGVVMLIALSAAYGGKKTLEIKQAE
jgi:hypothetical protein